MTVKAIVYFGGHDYGWSETYYLSGDDPAAHLATVQVSASPPPRNSFGAAMVRRKNMLLSPARILHVRCSLVANPHVFDAKDVPRQFGNGAFGPGPDFTPLLRNDALLIEQRSGLVGSSIFRRRIYLHGLSSDWSTTTDELSMDNAAQTATDNFLAQIVGEPFVLLTRNIAPAAKPLTGFGVNDDGRSAVATISDAVLTPQTKLKVIVRKLKAPAGWNGTYNGVVLTQSNPPGIVTIQIGPGKKHRPSQPVFIPATGAEILINPGGTTAAVKAFALELTTHRVGRPFDAPRGRRSTV